MFFWYEPGISEFIHTAEISHPCISPGTTANLFAEMEFAIFGLTKKMTNEEECWRKERWENGDKDRMCEIGIFERTIVDYGLYIGIFAGDRVFQTKIIR